MLEQLPLGPSLAFALSEFRCIAGFVLNQNKRVSPDYTHIYSAQIASVDGQGLAIVGVIARGALSTRRREGTFTSDSTNQINSTIVN
jgi:hypothetical protein